MALAVIYAALYSPFAIFLMRTYFLGIPLEIEESAAMDGATPWQTFTRILLPLVRPGLLTLALLAGLYAWNEFLFASTFLQTKPSQTAIAAFFTLSGQYTSDWGEIMAGALDSGLPGGGAVSLLAAPLHRGHGVRLGKRMSGATFRGPNTVLVAQVAGNAVHGETSLEWL